MKKKSILVLAIGCLLLVLSACGGMSGEELRATMPQMAVISGTQQALSATGGGNWTYQKNSAAIDAVHPLQSEESLTTLSESSSISAAAGEEVGMYFGVSPDSVTVTYLPENTDVSNGIPEGETVDVAFGIDKFYNVMPEVSNDVVVTYKSNLNSYSDKSGTLDYYFIVTH
ncbi:MAG: hypothetical protein K2O18_05130 [Oscillospiraceae bacterium]|nr:hypothetical protein [Oscillospiraceae bacterium]